MAGPLQALRGSVERLRHLVANLDDAQLAAPAYPAEWSIADVLSHLGSGAVIMRRRLDDTILGQPGSADFAAGVWQSWNAKSDRAKADDALIADQELLGRIASVTDAERAGFRSEIGPVSVDFDAFVDLRLNEHAFHSWDIAVALDPQAVLAAEAGARVVDNLELVARFTARPTGGIRTIAVRTSGPTRHFTITFGADAVTLTPRDSGRHPDLELPAEAFARLIYGRLDTEHTPSVEGDLGVLDEIRRAFPGP
jgi:uncharacterized protein (TIGR03083 family)